MGKDHSINAYGDATHQRRPSGLGPCDDAPSSSKLGASVRDRLILKATSELLAANDSETMLRNIVHLLVPELGDWCLVNLATPSGIRRFSEARSMSSEKSAALDEIRRRFPPNPAAKNGLGAVIRTGQAQIFHDFNEEKIRRVSNDEDYIALWKCLDIVSWVAVPIKVRGKIYGGLSIESLTPGHYYDEADLAFAEEIAGLMGLALERAQLVKEATDANRQKDEFLAMLSHELRTPLSAILGWSQLMMKKSLDKNFDCRRAISTIERNARLQKALVDDILDLSLVSTGRMQIDRREVDLDQLLRSAIETTLPLAQGKQIELSLQKDCDGPAWVIGDAGRLQQVMLNLLNNAIKFTPQQGRVVVTLSARLPRRWTIQVTDTGIGIPAEFLPHVFERFRQADSSIGRSYGGLGLGLALVQHIVELHGGQVYADSPGEGKGSSVILELPSKPYEEPDGN